MSLAKLLKVRLIPIGDDVMFENKIVQMVDQCWSLVRRIFMEEIGEVVEANRERWNERIVLVVTSIETIEEAADFLDRRYKDKNSSRFRTQLIILTKDLILVH